MSSQRTLMIKVCASLSVAAFAVFGFLRWNHVENEQAGRSIASAHQAHSGFHTKGSKLGELIHTEKIHGPVSVRIVAVTGYRPGEPMTLRGIVTTDDPLNTIKAHWVIPPGVSVVSGSIDHTITDLDSGEESTFEITIKMLTDDNYQVHLSAGSQDAQSTFSETAQYNTRDEEAIQQAAKALKLRSESYIREQQKVYQ